MEERSCVPQLMTMSCKGGVAGILSPTSTHIISISLQFKLVGSFYFQAGEDVAGGG